MSPPPSPRSSSTTAPRPVATGRAQATPITAWLRVPLDWYQSATVAYYPDETHASIRRIFYPARAATARSSNAAAATRRHFCGYCGTTLSAYDESVSASSRDTSYLDVTLGSLTDPSLDVLETLRLLASGDDDDGDDDDDEDDENDGHDNENVESDDKDAEQRPDPLTAGLVTRGATLNEETHIQSTETQPGGVDNPLVLPRPRQPQHSMRGRGIPYFEEMVEHSRLGRIKRRRGGQVSADGTAKVTWEVVEVQDEGEEVPDSTEAKMEGEVEEEVLRSAGTAKRRKVG